MLRYRGFQGVRRFVRMALDKQKQKQDCLIICAGKEGGGKSTLMLDILDEIEKQSGQTINIEQITFSLADFLKTWSKYRKNQVIVLDEGKDLKRLNFRDKAVQAFEKLMTVSRMDANIYIICITNPFHAIRYVAEDKVNIVLFAQGRKKIKVHSGHGMWLKMNKTKDDKSIKKFKSGCLFEDDFPKYEGHLLEEYEVKKEAFKNKSHEGIAELMGSYEEKDEFEEAAGAQIDKMVGIPEAATYLGVAQKTVRKYIKSGKLPSVKMGIAYRVSISEIMKLQSTGVS